MAERKMRYEVQELFVVEYDTDGSIEFYNWRAVRNLAQR